MHLDVDGRGGRGEAREDGLDVDELLRVRVAAGRVGVDVEDALLVAEEGALLAARPRGLRLLDGGQQDGGVRGEGQRRQDRAAVALERRGGGRLLRGRARRRRRRGSGRCGGRRCCGGAGRGRR